jgi:hypothetical protein
MPESTFPRTVAYIESRDPPPEVVTLADWSAWRQEEDRRMLCELDAWLEAVFAIARARTGL